jgi:hypothetical protein
MAHERPLVGSRPALVAAKSVWTLYRRNEGDHGRAYRPRLVHRVT